MGSQPLTLRCPKCRRGCWGYPIIKGGIKKSLFAKPKLIHQGSVPRWKVKVCCIDCGHEWWTVHACWTDNHRAVGRSSSGSARHQAPVIKGGKPVIVVLDISTFEGVVRGASHFFGKLSHGDMSVELEREIDAREAVILNRKDTTTGWLKGMRTNRWDTRNGLLDEARRVWREHFPDGALLVFSEDYLEPCEVLDGPPEWKDRLNEIWKEFEKLDGWEGDDEKRVEELYAEWGGLTRGFGR